jgi:hypothetical protein
MHTKALSGAISAAVAKHSKASAFAASMQRPQFIQRLDIARMELKRPLVDLHRVGVLRTNLGHVREPIGDRLGIPDDCRCNASPAHGVSDLTIPEKNMPPDRLRHRKT